MSDIGQIRKAKKIEKIKKNSTFSINQRAFNPKWKIAKGRFINKLGKIKRAPRKAQTDYEKISKERFLRIKSFSPANKILKRGTKETNFIEKKASRNIPKLSMFSRKNNPRVLSPVAKMMNKLVLHGYNSQDSSSKRSSKRGTPFSKYSNKRIIFNFKPKFSKFNKPDKIKKLSNSRISKIFGDFSPSSSKHNVSVNQRYNDLSTLQTPSEQRSVFRRRISHCGPSNSIFQNFEVYNSINQEESPANILANFQDCIDDSTENI
ncbi:unnamed protein product [Moneuplotes crassus]|uniref:Uncharacterized protein n=1 Tax=Euplotes crassus TaxID=5936 RepID=A0AAD1Y732_EUPCR|nr:unnamed protein product [Moneuplotes crassus]